jgi:hypothetical protein
MTEAIEPATRQALRFEEDPVGNFLLAADLAPRLCRDCATYHTQYTARRAARLTSGEGEVNALDHREMADVAARLLAERAGADRSPITVTLAGSADTGILATLANAADAAGEGIVERMRFRVLDICPTPLALCAWFGRRHGLEVGIQTLDLLGEDSPGTSDFLVLHSIFRFVPHERHAELLSRLMTWLKPGGKLLFSMGVGKRAGPETEAALAAFRDLFRREVEAGRIPYARSADAFLAGLNPYSARAGDMTEVETIRTLFRDTGVRVESWQEIQGDHRKWRGRSRVRVIAVLSRPD